MLVVFYGCETWFLTLREKHRQKAFENRVLMRIFGPKRDEIIGGWKKLLDEELHNLYSSTNINSMIKSKCMREEEHVACIREKLNVHRDLVGKSEGKKPSGSHQRNWEDNFKIDPEEI
jgi:hypothetical protein